MVKITLAVQLIDESILIVTAIPRSFFFVKEAESIKINNSYLFARVLFQKAHNYA